MFNVLARIKAEPWAITPSYMETILDIAQRQNSTPEQMAQQLGRPLENTYDVEVRNGVAILPVNGPLFRYANMFSKISGATSYQNLARDFFEAVDDPDVKAIVLDIDSPGGEANGVSEFAEQIYQARGKKKIIAYVGGSAASAAYWIASAADEIVIDETAMLGSIGTVLGVTVTKKRDEKEGIERFDIVSKQSPYKRVDASTDEGRSRLQAVVDQLSDVFVDKVARNRGYTRDIVLSDFGQGDILIGNAAVNAGMANRLGSFEGVIEQLSGPSGRQSNQRLTLSAPTGTENATQSTQTPTEPSAGKNQEEEESDFMDLEKLKAEHPDVYKAAMQEGESAERARMQAIDGITLKGHEDLIAKAKYDAPISAEMLAVQMIQAEQAKGDTFLASRKADAEELEGIDSGAADNDDPQAAKAAAEKEEHDAAIKAATRGFNARSGRKN